MKEEAKYYLSADLMNSLGEALGITVEGLKSMKNAFENEVKKADAECIGKDLPIKSINRIKVISGMADIVRIFEAMKEAEIISNGKTEVSQIADIFFNEALDKKKFESTYNARKSDTVEQERNSYSKALEEFIKILILKSFSKKDRALENFIGFIEAIQRNKEMGVE